MGGVEAKPVRRGGEGEGRIGSDDDTEEAEEAAADGADTSALAADEADEAADEAAAAAAAAAACRRRFEEEVERARRLEEEPLFLTVGEGGFEEEPLDEPLERALALSRHDSQFDAGIPCAIMASLKFLRCILRAPQRSSACSMSRKISWSMLGKSSTSSMPTDAKAASKRSPYPGLISSSHSCIEIGSSSSSSLMW